MIPLGPAPAPRGAATPPALAQSLERGGAAGPPPAAALGRPDRHRAREEAEAGGGVLDGKAGRGGGHGAAGGEEGCEGGGGGEPRGGGPRCACVRRPASDGSSEEVVGRACGSGEERGRRSRAGEGAQRVPTAGGGERRGAGERSAARRETALALAGRPPAGGADAGRGAQGGALPEAAPRAPASSAEDAPPASPAPSAEDAPPASPVPSAEDVPPSVPSATPAPSPPSPPSRSSSTPSPSPSSSSSSSPLSSSPLSPASLYDPALQPALVQGLCTAGCRPSVAERAADLVLARERAAAAKRPDRPGRDGVAPEGAQLRSAAPSTPPPLYPSLERLLPPAARLAASLEGRARRGGPAAVAARRRELAAGARLALDLASRRRAVAVLLAGTSGTGKSTLASLLAARLGFSAALSTDSVRAALRGFADPRKDAVLFASTYDAGGALEGGDAEKRGGVARGAGRARTASAERGEALGEGEAVEAGEGELESLRGGDRNRDRKGEGGEAEAAIGRGALERARGCVEASSSPDAANATPPASFPPPASPPLPPPALHPRTLEGYRLQRSRVLPRVEQLVLSALRRGQSIVVEGVHLSPARAAALVHEAHAQWARQVAAERRGGGKMGGGDGCDAPAGDADAGNGVDASARDRDAGNGVDASARDRDAGSNNCAPLPRSAVSSLLPPLILPVVLHIRSAARHAERFSVRAKSGSLRARDNRYVRHLEAIRAIQALLLDEAKQAACPALHNANVDRTLAVVHGALLRLASRDEGRSNDDGSDATIAADPPLNHPSPGRERGDPLAPAPLRLSASLELATTEAAAAAWSKRGALAAIRERNASGARGRKEAAGEGGSQASRAETEAGTGPAAQRAAGEGKRAGAPDSPPSARPAGRERFDAPEGRAPGGALKDTALCGDLPRAFDPLAETTDHASDARVAHAPPAPSAPLCSPRSYASPACVVEPQPRARPEPNAQPLEGRPRSLPAALSLASSPTARGSPSRAPDTPQPSEQGRNAASCRACGPNRRPPATARRSNPEGGSPLAIAATLAAAARGLLSAVAAAAARRSPLAKAPTDAGAREGDAREGCGTAEDGWRAGRAVVAGAGPNARRPAERSEDGARSPHRPCPPSKGAPAMLYDAPADLDRAPGFPNPPRPSPPLESPLLASPPPCALSALASRLLSERQPAPASRPLATPCAPPCTRASSPPPAAPRSPSAAHRAPRPGSSSPALGGAREGADEEASSDEAKAREGTASGGGPGANEGGGAGRAGGSCEMVAAVHDAGAASAACDVPATLSLPPLDLLRPPHSVSYSLQASPSRAHRSAPSLPSARSPTGALPCPARRPLSSQWCQRPQSPWSDPGHDASCSSAEEGSHGCSWSASGAASAEHSWLEGPWLAEASEQGARGGRSDADEDAPAAIGRGAPEVEAQQPAGPTSPPRACSHRLGGDEGDVEGDPSPRHAGEGWAGAPAGPSGRRASGGDAESAEACSCSNDWLPLGAFGHARRRCAGSAAPALGDAATSAPRHPATLAAPVSTGRSRLSAAAAPLPSPSSACPLAAHVRSFSDCLGPPSPLAGDDHPLRLGGSPEN